MSTITFTVNSHADNHFFKHVYLFQILFYMILYYSIFKSDLIVKHRSYFKNSFFTVDYVKIIELHIVHT